MIKTRRGPHDDDDAFDENGLLKDGRSFRVRMTMRDANSVAGQIAASKRVISDGSGNPLSLHRPGNRVLSDASAYDAVRAAFEQATADSENAWRAGPGGVQQDALPPAVDSVPAPATMDAAQAERIKREAYDAMCKRGEEAWRKGPGG
jgi:hypothetical protein